MSYRMRKLRMRIPSQFEINCKDRVLVTEKGLLGKTRGKVPHSWRNQSSSHGDADRHILMGGIRKTEGKEGTSKGQEGPW